MNVDYEEVAHGRAKGASRHREKAKRSHGKKEPGSGRQHRAEEAGQKQGSQEPDGSARKATDRSKPDERLHAPVAGEDKHMRLDRKQTRNRDADKFNTIDPGQLHENSRHSNEKRTDAQVRGFSSNKKGSELFRSRIPSRGMSNSRNGSRPSRGTRVFNYNEDDALKQSYVERVLRNSQQQAVSRHHREDQLNPATPSDSRTIDLQEAQNDSEMNIDINSRLDQAFPASQTPASHLRHQSLDFSREYKDHSGAQGGSRLDSSLKLHLRSFKFATAAAEAGSIDAPSKREGHRGPELGQAARIMGSFLISKQDSATVTGRATQQRNRHLRNSFQPGKDVQMRSNIFRSSAKFATLATEHPAAVGPRARISVPKHLVLHQLSKNVDVLANDRYGHVHKQMSLNALGQQPMLATHLRSIS